MDKRCINMSISTNAYQHISFSKFLVEAEGLTVKDITAKWSTVVPYRQKYINKEEVDKIGDLLALPENNEELMKKAVKALGSGIPIGSAADARNVVYDKPISGNVFIFEDENIKQMEKMLRQKELGRKIVTDLEKAHIEKRGITIEPDQVYKVDKLANLKAMVSLVPQDMAYYFHGLLGSIHIGLGPHIYMGDDADMLKSIIYHEVRHAYDGFFAGIKKGEYDYMSMTLGSDIELKKYYKSLSEARAYTDQIIYLIEKYKKKFNLSTDGAVRRIQRYLMNTSNRFCAGLPPIARQLFIAFSEEIANNPKLAGFSEESAIVQQYEDVQTIEQIGQLYEKIMETFRYSHNHEVGEM